MFLTIASYVSLGLSLSLMRTGCGVYRKHGDFWRPAIIRAQVVIRINTECCDYVYAFFVNDVIDQMEICLM